MAQTNTERRSEVSGLVRAELAKRKITGRRLAAAMGWSATTTSRRLSGATSFTVEEIEQVARYLHVPVTVFFQTEQTSAA